MAEAIDYSIFVARSEDGLAQMSLAIDGIDCAACMPIIETATEGEPHYAWPKCSTCYRNWESCECEGGTSA